ncbi:GLE1-like protein [Dioscorea alata]|nr:GLE1-like protein [Dioscorea alata]KAH7681588.1 GLE1-like protein [Dioscorea alata]KAH7681589.1 GLE1-like protein [Dioscorea alata]KAH7681590.1 GLE1-like protein [Dioscorea alata]KAH7681595.1 GLE1-like protein [Dioscorea alata]
MVFVQLELPCPKSCPVIAAADPQPQWTLGDLLLEINTLELQLGNSSSAPVRLKEGMHSEFSHGHEVNGGEPFIMCISDEDVEDFDSDDGERFDKSLGKGTRFSCADLDLSDLESSEDEGYLKITPHLAHKKGPEDSILFEYECEREIKVKEAVRCKLSSLEASLSSENGLSSALIRVANGVQARIEAYMKLDNQYKRKIAEMTDSHLSAIQRRHEQRCQIEERRIREDAATEEARRKEIALLEEKVQQEKAKAEREARLRAVKLAEEAQKAAREAAIKESKEAAEKEAVRATEFVAEALHNHITENIQVSPSKVSNNIVSNVDKGIKVLAADNALKVEESRIKFYDEVAQEMMLNSNEEFDRCGRQISKLLRQINRTQQKVRAVSVALVGIIDGPQCPRPISCLLVAQKVVSLCENPNASFDSTAFAWGHVILSVTSQVPAVMDLLIAALHKACIYTVPKHLQPTESPSKSNDYLKIIGYREEEGCIESSDSYLKRVESYMKLYAAIIQTQVPGIQNPHGLKEGWAWLSRFLNNLPANRTTAVALHAFLKMAGFALFKRYRSQFRKILNFISDNFLPVLKKRDDASKVYVEIEEYLQSKAYLTQPEGWSLQSGLLSRELV